MHNIFHSNHILLW